MFLKTYGIKNFKAFGDKDQEFAIKPLTLVFGPNSSGKSSLIHSLLWFNHLVKHGDPNIRFPQLAEKQVDLGGFKQFLYQDATEKKEIAVRFSFGSELMKSSDNTRSMVLNGEEFEIPSLVVERDITMELIYGLDYSGKPRLSGFAVNIDGDPLLRFKISSGSKLTISEFNFGSASLKNFWEHAEFKHDKYANLITAFGPDGQFAYTQTASDLLRHWNIAFKIEFGLPEYVETEKFNLFAENHFFNLFFQLLGETVASVMSTLNKRIRMDMDSMRYLPPLRDIPDRHFDPRESGDMWAALATNEELLGKVNQWLRGDWMNTKYELKSETYVSITSVGLAAASKARSALQGVLNDQDFVNEYHSAIYARWALWEKMENWERQGYYLENPDLQAALVGYWMGHIEDLQYNDPDAYGAPLASDEETFREWVENFVNDLVYNDELDEVAEHFIDDDPELQRILDTRWDQSAFSKNVAREALEVSGNARTGFLLQHLSNKSSVSLRDVGVGVSQVLPVIVSALGEKKKTIAIEQPELHIHPALQAELGDLFIESALGENQNCCILETHSEHLILRILRRIRETTRGKLPEGVRGLSAEDVSVLYIESGEGGAEIRELRINEQGRFIDDWPNGFFEERFNEEF